MKKIHSLITFRVLKVSAVTLLLCTLMLDSVQLFMNLDNIVQASVPLVEILRLMLLSTPTSILYALSPSLLFGVSLSFSQMYANNEMIVLYNAGFSRFKMIFATLLCGLLISIGSFAFNEYVTIPCERKRIEVESQLFGSLSKGDNRNVVLNDYPNNYLFTAQTYYADERRANSVTVIFSDSTSRMNKIIKAKSAVYENGEWVFNDAEVLSITADGIESEQKIHCSDKRVSISPELLKDNSEEVSLMSLKTLRKYLERIRVLDSSRWQEVRVDYIKRLFSAITPFVMVLIACTISYRYKKNILLFTIILSIVIAVIYYVSQMFTLLFARQGVWSAEVGMAIPFVLIFVTHRVLNLLMRLFSTN